MEKKLKKNLKKTKIKGKYYNQRSSKQFGKNYRHLYEYVNNK